jgi:hypothetical protein
MIEMRWQGTTVLSFTLLLMSLGFSDQSPLVKKWMAVKAKDRIGQHVPNCGKVASTRGMNLSASIGDLKG